MPRARRVAASLALAYIVLCCAYIIASSALATRFAHASVERLAAVEKVKGVAFVAITGIGFYFIALRLLRRVEERQDALTRSREALVTAERRALAGVFASSIAHDMNNILTVAGANAAELADATSSPAARAATAEQLDQALRDLSVLTRRLLAIGRHGSEGAFCETHLLPLAQRTIELAHTHAALRGARIAASGDATVAIPADPGMIGQLLLNLLLNAGEATDGHGRVDVVVRRGEPGAILEVHDDGPGVPEDARERIFEPFATTKAHGSGLGLVSVRAVAERHGGTVEVAKSEIGGALFRVRLAGAPVAGR